jgi:LSD1 subclass zinc finger protein
MRTGFHDRVVVCTSCGAPLQAPPDATSVRCTHCGAESVLVVRVDDPVASGWSKSELERLAMLQAQSTAPSFEPAVAPLVTGTRLLESAYLPAFALWQQTRAAQQAGHAGAERPLVELGLLLAHHAAEQNDVARERAVLETTLGLTRTPSSRQELSATLAAGAARAGDIPSAEAWLGLCDPRATELRADSAYRHARALVDTAAGRFPRVLAVLGGSDVDVPIARAYVAECALLRANAWERLGRLGTAVDLLLHHKHDGEAFTQQQTRRFYAHNQGRLCPESEPRAEQRRELTLGLRKPYLGAGMIVILVLASYFCFVAAGATVLAFLSLGISDIGGPFEWFVVAFALGLVGVILLAITIGGLRSHVADRRVRRLGVVAPALVLSGGEQGESTPGAVELHAKLLVVPDRGTPFPYSLALRTSAERARRIHPGATLNVRHHGTDVDLEPMI